MICNSTNKAGGRLLKRIKLCIGAKNRDVEEN